MMDEYLLEMKTGAGCSASTPSAGHRKEVADYKERGELRC